MILLEVWIWGKEQVCILIYNTQGIFKHVVVFCNVITKVEANYIMLSSLIPVDRFISGYIFVFRVFFN